MIELFSYDVLKQYGGIIEKNFIVRRYAFATQYLIVDN